MGWSPSKQALNARDIVIDGSQSLGDDPFRWTAQSPLAGVKKRLREDALVSRLKDCRPKLVREGGSLAPAL